MYLHTITLTVKALCGYVCQQTCTLACWLYVLCDAYGSESILTNWGLPSTDGLSVDCHYRFRISSDLCCSINCWRFVSKPSIQLTFSGLGGFNSLCFMAPVCIAAHLSIFTDSSVTVGFPCPYHHDDLRWIMIHMIPYAGWGAPPLTLLGMTYSCLSLWASGFSSTSSIFTSAVMSLSDLQNGPWSVSHWPCDLSYIHLVSANVVSWLLSHHTVVWGILSLFVFLFVYGDGFLSGGNS